MENIKNKIKNSRCFSYVMMFFAIFLSYLIIYGSGSQNNIQQIHYFMIMSLAAVVIYIAFLKFTDQLEMQKIIKCIILLGFIMRIGYMLYTPCTIRQHDIGSFQEDSTGHAGYILNILDGHLPYSNKIQFYHPPLFYILSAFVIKVVGIFVNTNDNQTMIEGAKIISCFASCGILLIMQDICKELRLKEISALIAITFTAFLPQYYLLAGRVNNDSLSIFFIALGILFTLKWYSNPNYKNTIILALAFGLGIMTKISVGVLAIVTGIAMIIKGYKCIREGTISDTLKKFGLFGIISFPLALWYPIRNYILFNQPINYVLDMKGTDSKLYCGDHNIFERFISFPIIKLINPIYNSPSDDYNTSMYLLKSALFGEFKYSNVDIIARILIILFLIICIITVAAAIKFVLDKKQSNISKFIITAIFIVFYIMYISFNVKYPYGCTMDYRYVVPMAISQGIFLGKAHENILNEKIKNIYTVSVGALLLIFSVFSIVMFTFIK